jgi:ABC-2 type transport system permease protein
MPAAEHGTRGPGGDIGVVDLVTVGQAERASARARILDRGYTRYTGPRRGTAGAVQSLTRQSFQHTLGIRRSFSSKIWPLISVVIAYVPAIVFVGITALLNSQAAGRADTDRILDSLLPTYPAYYGFIVAAIWVFVAFVAPEVLCTDRRNGLLGLYLASPLDRDTYLVAKSIAVALALSLVTLGPPLLYLVGLTLNGRGPDGLAGFAGMLGRIVVASVVVTALYVSLSFAVAATTTRRAAASAAIILIMLAAAGITETLVNGARLDAHLLVLDIVFLPFELVFRIFGTGSLDTGTWATVSTGWLAAAWVAWTASFALFVRFRYQRLRVTR